jgi:ATP-dependent Clp protease ATP-binding subunit ClpC
MWQRFTERARKVVFYAQEEAQKFGEGYVSTEHLLLGLVRESDSVAARVLDKLGVSLNRVRAEVEKQLPRGDARPNQDMTLTPRAKRVIIIILVPNTSSSDSFEKVTVWLAESSPN